MCFFCFSSRPVGDTTYGFLQMHWTTQIPVVDQGGFHSERTAHGNMRQASELYGDGPRDGAHGWGLKREDMLQIRCLSKDFLMVVVVTKKKKKKKKRKKKPL